MTTAHGGSRYTYATDAPPLGTPEERTQLLGGKGANLAVMERDLGLPVPPAFTITTGACLAYQAEGWPEGLDDELRAQLDRLGERIGRRFGDPDDPLLVSVRSGAPVSMPGMMDTILDLGLNDAMVAGLAATSGDPSFAADCLRRFRESYRAVIGTDAPDDPWAQLRTAVAAVFDSWMGDRARAYRLREGISDDLGTAVTVQAMVFGNGADDSGTGVLFTRNPATGEAVPYGDVLFDAQGEDVVAGTHATLPIAELGERLPDVSAELARHAATLERHFADCCDIEFTIERGRLWLLQVRTGKRSPAAALRMAVEMAEDDTFPLTREDAVRRVAHLLADPPTTFVPDGELPAPIATGLPASPGLATGSIVTSSEAAEAAADAGEPVILVRAETSPEDVRGMARAAGILTARGGLASHAAVVARGWGIPAVVGAAGVEPGEDGMSIAGTAYPAGTELTIDGGTGEVRLGRVAGSTEVVPEAATLRGWAEELGVDLPAREAPTERDTLSPEPEARSSTAAADVLRALLVKGTVPVDAFADALVSDAGAVDPVLRMLADGGQVAIGPDGAKLTAEGRKAGEAAFADDREAIGSEAASGHLEAFHPLDLRMKEIVTAWQLREVGGQQVLNDHTDDAYDRGVLDDLGALHGDASAWLEPLAGALGRYETYRSRLGRAVERAEDEGRWIASPRVDSYHSVWFELHEDLIRLAGRSREEEAEAGRA